MRHGQAFLLVYSVTDRRSFEEIPKLRDQIFRGQDKDISAQIPMVMVGNKCDLEGDRQVSFGEGQDLAKSFKIPFMEVSAKTRANVDECFFELVRLNRKARGKKDALKEKKQKKFQKIAKIFGSKAENCSIL
jgi:GTPase KRas protein